MTEKQRERVELAAQQVLDVRDEFSMATLADLDRPLSMPAKLVKAHAFVLKLRENNFRKSAVER